MNLHQMYAAAGAGAGIGVGLARNVRDPDTPLSFNTICNTIILCHYNTSNTTPELACVLKIAKVQKAAKTFHHVQKWAPPDARRTVMASFEDKLSMVIRVYATRQRAYLMPMTAMAYVFILNPSRGTIDELIGTISSASFNALCLWDNALTEYSEYLIDKQKDDVPDYTTNTGPLSLVEHSIVEDIDETYAREQKYTLRILTTIIETRRRRLDDAYIFLWVCKHTGVVYRDVAKIVVDYIKNGG